MWLGEYNAEVMKLTIKSPVKSNTVASCMADYNEIGGIPSDPKAYSRIPETSSYGSSLLIKRWIRASPDEHCLCAIPPTLALPVLVLGVSSYRARLIETEGEIAPYCLVLW